MGELLLNGNTNERKPSVTNDLDEYSVLTEEGGERIKMSTHVTVESGKYRRKGGELCLWET